MGKILWRRKWQPTPVLLPGKSHGRRLIGYSPWGGKESDTAERLYFTYFRGFSGGTVVKNPPTNSGDIREADSIPGLGRSPGEGNGYLFQYSCLENPMDREAWQAIAYGVTKSWT